MFGLFCMFIASAHLGNFSLLTLQRFLLSNLNNHFCQWPLVLLSVSCENINFILKTELHNEPMKLTSSLKQEVIASWEVRHHQISQPALVFDGAGFILRVETDQHQSTSRKCSLPSAATLAAPLIRPGADLCLSLSYDWSPAMGLLLICNRISAARLRPLLLCV